MTDSIKKGISALLAFAVLLICMTACGNNNTNSQNNTQDHTNNKENPTTASYTIEGSDLVYKFSTTEDQITIYLQLLDENREWKSFEGIALMPKADNQHITFFGRKNGGSAVYEGADSALFSYQIESDTRKEIKIPFTIQDHSKVTHFNRFFDNVTVEKGQEALLGYIIITNVQSDFSDWGPELYKSKSGITKDMQVIAVVARIN